MIRVLLVDDQALIRVGIREILVAAGDIEVVEASDGASALHVLEVGLVDVVLMDIRMAGMDGVTATRRIRERFGAERVRILVLTTFENDETVIEAIRAGADGFVGKGIEPADLVDAVRTLAMGGSPLSVVAADALVKHVSRNHPEQRVDPVLADRFQSLTPRERDVVRAVALGRTGDEIAADEHISRYTIKTHVSRAMMKVGATDRAQLVAFAFQAGILTGSERRV